MKVYLARIDSKKFIGVASYFLVYARSLDKAQELAEKEVGEADVYVTICKSVSENNYE